jgi:hypothetical protein
MWSDKYFVTLATRIKLIYIGSVTLCHSEQCKAVHYFDDTRMEGSEINEQWNYFYIGYANLLWWIF